MPVPVGKSQPATMVRAAWGSRQPTPKQRQQQQQQQQNKNTTQQNRGQQQLQQRFIDVNANSSLTPQQHLAVGRDVQLSPMSSPGAPLQTSAILLGDMSTTSQQQQQQQPCVLEDLLALSPETPVTHSNRQQQQEQLHVENFTSSSSTQHQNIMGGSSHVVRPTSAGKPPTSRSRPQSASKRPQSAGSAVSSGGGFAAAAAAAAVSAGDAARNDGDQQQQPPSPPLSPANLAKIGPLTNRPTGVARKESPTRKKITPAAAGSSSGKTTSSTTRRKSSPNNSQGGGGGGGNNSGRGGGGGGGGSGTLAGARQRARRETSGGGNPAVTALLGDDGTIEAEEEALYPLVAALHASRDQLHLPSRVIEWMREVLTWNVQANNHDANEKICSFVETLRQMTLELFKMVDEIEQLSETAMGAWRTIPSGSDSTMTARSHATFVDAYGRLKQIVNVFNRLVQRWQIGHAQLFDLVRPAAVPGQAASAFTFTCAASCNDDYIQRLRESMELLETTANSFSNMIFQGVGGSGSSGRANADMTVVSTAQRTRRASDTSGAAGASGGRRGSTNVSTLDHSGVSASSLLPEKALATQTAEEFGVVRRPISAARARAAAAAAAAAEISAADGGGGGGGGVAGGDEDTSQFGGDDRGNVHRSNTSVSTALFNSGSGAQQQKQQHHHITSTSSSFQLHLHHRANFEARRVRAIVAIQRWWKRVYRRLVQRGGVGGTKADKTADDALFDEAMTFISASQQQRWTKRDTMLLHDIARRLHFLRCIRRIERFCTNVWVPKHFACVKIQRAVRAYFWRKRDAAYRRRRRATIAIQRWFHECRRRSAQRKALAKRRAEIIKARQMRAANSAPTPIKAPPQAVVDASLPERQPRLLDEAFGVGNYHRNMFIPPPHPAVVFSPSAFAPSAVLVVSSTSSDLADNNNANTNTNTTKSNSHLLFNFALLGEGNLCVENFNRNGGVDGAAGRWSDDDDNVDGDNDLMDVSGPTDHGGNAKDDEDARKKLARPRSAAERLLIKPGKKVTSFTMKMLRYSNNKKG